MAPAERVLQWLAARQPETVVTTTITEAEILYGIEVLPAGKRRARLSAAVEDLLTHGFRGRILPFDEAAARAFPKIVSHRHALGRPISEFDAMIAAICQSRSLSIATRNVSDFEHCGIRVINPWAD